MSGVEEGTERISFRNYPRTNFSPSVVKKLGGMEIMIHGGVARMCTTKRKRKRTARSKSLPTIWEVPDDLWERIKPILDEFWPRKPTGRRHANWRLILNGIIFRMRSGCQWDRLPRKFGPKSTVHDWFQRWCAGGVMKRIWEALVGECQDLGGVQWEWQAADGWLGKARFGGEKGGEKPYGSWEKRHQEVAVG